MYLESHQTNLAEISPQQQTAQKGQRDQGTNLGKQKRYSNHSYLCQEKRSD